MVAASVARLTLASTTPSVFRRKRSIRLLQEAHVIPTTGKLTSRGSGVVGAVGVLALILPRSIPSVVGPTTRRARRARYAPRMSTLRRVASDGFRACVDFARGNARTDVGGGDGRSALVEDRTRTERPGAIRSALDARWPRAHGCRAGGRRTR